MSKKQSKKLEVLVKTNFDEMVKVSRDVGLDIDKVYCGYLRQPIESIRKEAGKDHFYMITGTCALTGEKCYRFVCDATQFRVDWCEEYITYFKRKG